MASGTGLALHGNACHHYSYPKTQDPLHCLTYHWKRNIVLSCHTWEQVERLEHKPELAQADVRQLFIRSLAIDTNTAEVDISPGRFVYSTWIDN